MNRTARVVLLAVPLALASAAHAVGGTADTPSKRVAARAAPDSGAQGGAVDFSLTDKLPPRYAGSDCGAIVRKLKSFNVAKSEYETTTAYGARIAALVGRKIDSAHTVADPIAFVAAESAIESSYAADVGLLNVSATWGRASHIIDDRSYPGVILAERLDTDREVMMSNAFGAAVRGSKSSFAVCALAFANSRDVDVAKRAISAAVPMPPAEAMAAKGKLALLYLGTIAPPFLGDYANFREATLDLPHQVTWHGDSVVLNLSEIWLFNRATGKVYKKVPIGGQPANMITAGSAGARTAPTVHGGSVEMDGCKPAYPARSKLQEETGTVTLSFWVSPESRVVDSKVVRSTGFRTLDKAAQEAISKCTFHPEVENGVPVDTWVDVRYTFSFDD